MYFDIGVRVLGGLLGFLLAIKSFAWLVDTVAYLEELPLLDKAAAVVGVLLGLVVAYLGTVPFAGLPGIGLPIRLLAAIASGARTVPAATTPATRNRRRSNGFLFRSDIEVSPRRKSSFRRLFRIASKS